MALNIKSPEVERLLDEVVRLTGESKTEAVRKALAERQERLALTRAAQPRATRLMNFLEDEVWPHIPPEQLGISLSKAEEEALLGYGEHGV